MKLGYVCLDCKLVYPICWYEPDKCSCGGDSWREAAPKDIKRAIKDLDDLLKRDIND